MLKPEQLSDERRLLAFDGIRRPWTDIRGTKKEPVRKDHLLLSILTCTANDVVGSAHPKAMPVLPTNAAEWATWLAAPVY